MFLSKPRDLDEFAFSGGDPSLVSFSVAIPAALPDLAPPNAAHLLKRLEDITFALVMLAVFGVPMLAVAALIRLTSRGPALFRQERIGLHGHRFTLLKFRTMRHDPLHWLGLRQATRDDDRVTWIGRCLRRSSFDEMPQLINVLRGEMSIVGPRPHAPGTCAGGRPFEHISHRYPDRHSVKPGMTGLAQVRGWRGETDTEDKLLRRLDSDLEYIANWALWQDLLILVRTIGAVLRARNAY